MLYEAAIEDLEYEVAIKNRYLAEQKGRIPELEEQLVASKAYKNKLEVEIQEINDAITQLKGN